ncbi:diguanylate cyclase domain-containing protein [Leptothoe kymatousa]|uniref:Diguanylate cyclase n=1 Tax=Leptothoe kymatousa TAU-MAC 1615 TaxID=2364775 RepID=A0ABS5Y3N8_9CYAN|nr:diguanylate cyclase [Leptothoe kymatousa]MBT9312440.1 diguanylate cyclase [Leptothoe kymatousa TAU-MAC 1615]
MIFSRIIRRFKKGYQLLCEHITLILVLLLCLGLGIGLAGSYNLSVKLVEAQAQQYARISIDTLNKTRVLYSENVAQRLRSVEGVTLTPEYHSTDGAIPVPATFSIELSENITDLAKGSIFRLYSDYPFPNRQATGGPQDSFEQDALAYLRKNPTASFFRKEKINDQVSFRYAEAVQMKASCVECHNKLYSSPKKDWKVGDVRGVIAITQPLDEILLMAQEGLRNHYMILIVLSLLAVIGLSLVISRFRFINVELEKKVADRTAELNRLANLDGLTQIANRRYFDQRLDEEWRRAIRPQLPLSLLLCDVDFFKPYNDTYGHQAGDDCLKTVSQALSTSAKRAGEVVARYGGEEFGIILPGNDTNDAVKVAQLIQRRLHEVKVPHAKSKIKPYVTISIGIATVIPSREQTWEQLIHAADQALYQAKEQGRDRYIIWDQPAPINAH